MSHFPGSIFEPFARLQESLARFAAWGTRLWRLVRPEPTHTDGDTIVVHPAVIDRANTVPPPLLRPRPLEPNTIIVSRFILASGGGHTEQVGMVAQLVNGRVFLSGPHWQEIDEEVGVDRIKDPLGYFAALIDTFWQYDQAVAYGAWFATPHAPEVPAHTA